jgi:uncharacterized phiE125 gp8 family phage protein
MTKYLDTSISVTYSSDLPVTVATAKQHLRVTHSSEDALIELYLRAAIRVVEENAHITLLASTVTQIFDAIPAPGQYVDLSLPLTSLTSMSYNTVEAPADFTTFTVGVIDAGYNRPRIYAPDGWPDGWQMKVIYTSGYTAETIPKPLIVAVLLTLSDMYENRTDSVKQLPTAVDHLIQPFKVMAKI